MKAWLLVFTILCLLVSFPSEAAWFNNQPFEVRQPDGKTIDCFISGDEFYNWIHDQEGYTLVQGEDGYYYYGILSDGEILPSLWKAGSINPASAGLVKWAKIPGEEYQKRKACYSLHPGKSVSTPHSGVLNNLVIFIRFSDDTEFTGSRASYDSKFNLNPGVSLRNYYEEVSYGKLSIQSTSYPECIPSVNFSYQNTHPRSYFLPYNATTNPNGYTEGADRTQREHALLRDAVTWVNAHSPVPPSINIDKDNDGLVDNVTFIVRGGTGGWSSLLWAHSWSLFSFTVNINDKRVYNYTFHPETQTDVGTLCHEMFHSLGAPDLYHYVNSSLQPVQSWDLMDNGFGHMGAYMKWKYSAHTWIDTIPTITASGTYFLNPLATSTVNCYRINSINSSNQYYVLEYRKKTGQYESNVPGSGLLIYRINSYYTGNSEGPPDEVYIYRPGGTISLNGDPSLAYYTAEEGRDSISDGTGPSGFLEDGLPGGLVISDVSSAGTTIQFHVTISNTMKPLSISANAAGTSQINLMWTKNPYDDPVLLAYSTAPFTGNPNVLVPYAAGDILPGGGKVLYTGPASGYSHTMLQPTTRYYYRLWSVGSGFLYSSDIQISEMTDCIQSSYPYSQDFNRAGIPDCWSTQTNVPGLQPWSVTPTSAAGGTPYELYFGAFQNASGYSRMIMVPFNTQGITKLNVSFRIRSNYFHGGATIKLQSGNNMTDWTDESWAEPSGTNPPNTPRIVNTTVVNNLDSPLTYLAITVVGDLMAQGTVYMDDFDISIAECNFFVVNVTANPANAGTVTGGGNYYPGQLATVNALPNATWNFLYWTVNDTIVSYQPSYSFVVQSNRELVAVFSQSKVSILLDVSPPGSAMYSGNGVYQLYQPVDISTVANEGYEFDRWTENGEPIALTPDYSFSALRSRNLVANYIHIQLGIDVTIHPLSAGMVSGQGVYNYGDTIHLMAVPYEGYQFTGWYDGNDLISSMADYSFIIRENIALEARFICPVCSVSVAADPPEAGSVSGGGSYPTGETVSVEANPNEGWLFDMWKESGVSLSSGPVYSFVVDQHRNLVAGFLKLYSVVAAAQPSNAGIVAGNGTFTAGGHCTLLAVADTGFVFSYWSENRDTLGIDVILDFVVSRDRSLVAHFVEANGIGSVENNSILLYPNPVPGKLILELEQQMPGNPGLIEIFDNHGKFMVNRQVSSHERRLAIDLSGLVNGIYYLRFSQEGQVLLTRKVVVLK